MDRPRADRRGVAERGYAAVLTALILVPLMGFAGFAVDVGSWYARASELSRAADAASLAGVVWLPDLTTATAVALETAERNGFDASDPDITINVNMVNSARLEVEIIDEDVPLYFSGLFLDDVEIGRRAVAEYIDAVPMGSPENFLGNDPILGEQPNLWLATFGPQTDKRSGDRYHTEACSSGVFCSSGDNLEFDDEGYFFKLDVPSSAGTLGIDLFDAVHHDYGDYCDAGWLFDDGTVAAEPWYVAGNPLHDGYPEERYEKARQSGVDNLAAAQWCPGDNGLVGNFEMTVIVRGPDNTPFNPANNPVLCWARFGNAEPTNRADFVTRLQDPTPNQPVASGGTGATAPNTYAFAEYFREWVRVCDITAPAGGDYFVQIRTNADTTDPTAADPSITTQGRNRYSMRAGFGTAGTPGYGSGVSITANGRLPMFVNRPGGDGVPTTFYLARVLPQYAGQTLRLDLFDLTDGSDLSVRFIPPTDSGLGAFTNCSMTMITGSGTSALTSSNCAASHTSEPRLRNGQSNGNAIVASIVVPTGYTCNTADPFGCWVTAEMIFDGTPADTTTWSAELSGDPIRLIE